MILRIQRLYLEYILMCWKGVQCIQQTTSWSAVIARRSHWNSLIPSATKLKYFGVTIDWRPGVNRMQGQAKSTGLDDESQTVIKQQSQQGKSSSSLTKWNSSMVATMNWNWVALEELKELYSQNSVGDTRLEWQRSQYSSHSF